MPGMPRNTEVSNMAGPPLPLGDLPLGVGAAAGFFLAPISTPETRLAETLLIETAEVATSASVQL
eukprot:CAMPEP_0113268860 /NCGR_PEP_ID=MMETSP0008_2-20120614/21408_1 /TAXON_ID=97485 /ORGANISM="Prymnesium parvum" /LENGTH=64 /DNA_ID=CAMNT_0000118069 /DNA_START=540 /DNA_END=734 /DNA_ORIENTATION=+ /assembly_acc=CAM_ASM_000153